MTRTKMLQALKLDEKIFELNKQIDKLNRALDNSIVHMTISVRTVSASPFSDIAIDSAYCDLQACLSYFKQALENKRDILQKEFEEL